tara:strand:- start:147 stop:293 length:147 start_codon:yes stop_codon:yes gene_type:complete
VTLTNLVNSPQDIGLAKTGKEIAMPMGKGTYGTKVGRPPKKKKKKAKK